jgi:hypothetical protein
MNDNHELKMKLQKIALMQATETLRRAGIDQDHKWYSLRLYEMQFAIYEQLKLAHELE